MKKIYLMFLLAFTSGFYAQSDVKSMEDVKYNYVSAIPFLKYDAGKKNLEYLKYFKATDANTSLLVIYMLSKDSIAIVSGGKMIKENRFAKGNSTGVRSIQPISNQKSLEIIFYREHLTEKITLNPEDLKTYKFVYVSRKEFPIHIEFTNIWKMFM